MMNVSLFMWSLCRSIADCPYLSNEVTDVLKGEIRDERLVVGTSC